MEPKPGGIEGLAQTTGKPIEKQDIKADAPAAQQDPVPGEDVPDPDEDDLDDLDGLWFPVAHDGRADK